jgi:2-polyprenyl-3-methyl-5-hydroxy-6-metoxy-1,4-benzoquinol methylase
MGAIDNDGVQCEPRTNCMICGASGSIAYRDLRDHLFDAPGTWSIRRCDNRRCRLAWLDPQPRPDEIIKLYRTYHTHESAPEEGHQASASVDVDHLRSKGWKRSAKRVARTLMPWWRLRIDADVLHFGDRRSGDALDIGCGGGRHLRMLSAAGWRTIGIDFDEQAVAAARRQGFDARTGALASFSFADGQFDRIFMGDVIEHLDDPASLLAECHRILKPKGRLIMITPNIDSYGHQAFGQDWRGLEVPRHLQIFSDRALARAARSGGFRHVEAFSRTRQAWPACYMVDQSRLIARQAGRTAPVVDGVALDRKASRRSLVSPARAEWIICVAEK